MAKLVKCKSCEKEVSKQAVTCPNCGAKLKKSKAGLKFLFIVGAGIALGFIIVNSQEKSAQEKVEKEKQVAQMPVSGITWDEVDSQYSVSSKLTDLQKEEKWKDFKGKKIQWSGKVAGVREGMMGGLILNVKMNPTTLTSDLSVTLKPDQKEKALALTEGSPVTISGILDTWGTLLDISIENGEIL